MENFFYIRDIEKTTDETLYNNLLNELPAWIKEAKEKRVLL
ncbi:VWA domain-containing protein [Bacillus cereus]